MITNLSMTSTEWRQFAGYAVLVTPHEDMRWHNVGGMIYYA